MFYDAQSLISTIVYLGIFLIEAFAFIDAISRPTQAFLAADKMNKQGWLIILGLALLVQILPISFMLMLIGLVAALVYLLDARPALRSVTRR
jgi:flagellar biosynthesis protein FlhB